MYRILLADDEGIMLESLKKIIESNFALFLLVIAIAISSINPL